MKQIHIQYHETAHGEFVLGSFEERLCLLHLRSGEFRKSVDDKVRKGVNAEFIEKESVILRKTKIQIDEYFNRERKKFDIPLLTVGTDFQKTVWKALQRISYGTATSYLDLAKAINNEKAVRAVANACRANAIGLIIPCHRVIGSDGSLVGYAGGLSLKKRLLELEESRIK